MENGRDTAGGEISVVVLVLVAVVVKYADFYFVILD